jgi:tRNA(Ile)-lysidine synthetase-like protein
MRKVRVELNSHFLSFECTNTRPEHEDGHITIKENGIHTISAIGKRIEISGITEGKELKVRPYLPGDRIAGKKVSKIMQDKKVPAALRKHWVVILIDNAIVSVAGLKDIEGINTVFPYED